MVTRSPRERDSLRIVILASVSELVTCEVTVSVTTGETIRVGTTELAFVPRLVVDDDVMSNIRW